ncbi:hypothetical protein BV22DRAFT_530784 [Leucogyrophana mollusca]|uniref:Uncharacterized protein n=1 Tax=Leucogyrophana mollusca TaxID=85980 RepID=A0ACB8BF55_9AGAM|nr:hypothetical protein BV22DRAFT_530784 [Leucogyrophana mollusca]
MTPSAPFALRIADKLIPISSVQPYDFKVGNRFIADMDAVTPCAGATREFNYSPPQSMSVLYSPTDIAIGQQLRGLDCLLVSFLTLLTYDYIINLDHEVAYVFGTKLSVSKCTYLVCRYAPFIFLGFQWPITLASGLGIKTCSTMFHIRMWLNVVTLCAVECVFLLRTHALWGCNKRILVVLLSSLVVTLVSVVAVLGTYQASAHDLFSEPPIPAVGSCYKSEVSWSSSLPYLLLLVFETGNSFDSNACAPFTIIAEIFLFTIYRARVHYRSEMCRLLEILIQHSIFFYVIALLFALTNILLILFLPSYYDEAFGVVQALAQALLVTRMQLSLWKADRRHVSDVSLLSSGVPGMTLVFRPVTVLEEP